jgi:hypothetical protein
MGLDMYLKKKTFIGAEYEHRKVEGVIEIRAQGKPINIDFKKVSEITESAGYWRKANAIHAWFVKEVQDGVDECQESYVDYDKLLQLKSLCEKVIETKDATPLPPTSGFFFGSTEVDEYYFEDLKDTINIIEALDPEGSYYYRASW